MKVVTYGTKIAGGLPILKSSFERFARPEDEFVLLGLGDEWKGFGERILKVLEYAQTCDPNELLLCVDAYDVILTNSLGDLELKYQQLIDENGKDRSDCIVMSTEKQNYWMKKMFSLSFGLAPGDITICAGVSMGTAKSVIKLIGGVCADGGCTKPNFDDQKAFVGFSHSVPDFFVYDTAPLLFATVTDESTVHYHSDGTMTTRNGVANFVLHLPGNKSMNKAIIELGYDPQFCCSVPATQYYLQRIVHTFNAFPIVTYLCIILLIVILVTSCFGIWYQIQRQHPR